jgi:hypothetical protein
MAIWMSPPDVRGSDGKGDDEVYLAADLVKPCASNQ